VPGDLIGPLFDALNSLGFELVKAECEAVSSGFQPFVQEFEFKPVRGAFRSKLDELEVVCFPQADNADVIMEIDRKARGLGGFFAELTDMDETRIKFSFNSEDLPHLSEQLLEMIEQWSE
jgi:sporulation-control protein